MTTGARLGAYGLVLAAALAIGAALGSVAGPIDVGGDDHRDDPETSTTVHEGDHGGFGP